MKLYHSKNKIAERISSVAVLKGDFTLSSGKQSNYYIDKYKFCSDPVLLMSVANLLCEYIDEDEPDRVAGAELGGIPIVTAVSLASKIPALYVRKFEKAYGSKKKIDGDFRAGHKVLLFEDICTTGTQITCAAERLRDNGLTVIKIISVVDRLEGAREKIESAGFEYESVFTKEDIL